MSTRTKQTCCPVLELRQYTLHPGKRDVLIELFDREFIEPQEAAGMKIIGQFRDLERPERFVWLRGFSDMPSRAQALGEFYSGPIWKAHRAAANATMIDSDNVLLLRRVSAGTGFSLGNSIRPARGASEEAERIIVVTMYYFAAPVSDEFVEFFERTIKPESTAAGGTTLAYFVSEHAENTFPALPVRENENVFVWFAQFGDPASYDLYQSALAQSDRWLGEITETLAHWLKGTPEILRLSPTARSLL